MISSPLAKRLIVLFAVLSATNLYTIIFFPAAVRDMIQFAGVGLILFLYVADLLWNPHPKIKQYFRVEIYMFLIATFLSMFVASGYHHQNFGTTLIVQRFMYFYFFYFVLHSIRPSIRDMERVILALGVTYAVLFLAQYVVYPVRLFESRVSLDRGTIRIFIPGGGFMVFIYYKALKEFLVSKKVKYLFLALVFFAIPGILQGTRQSLAIMTLLTMAYIFFNKEIKSKALIFLMASVAGLAIFALFYDIFMEMVAVSEHDVSATKTNIRILAIRYFMTDFMPADIAYIFGNGQDSLNSPFGKQVHMYKLMRGFYQSDIGLIGDYSKFGVLFVIAQFSVLIKIIFGKIPGEISWVRYYFIGASLSMFTGANGFGNPSGIIFIIIALYYIDLHKNKAEQASLETENNAEKPPHYLHNT